MDTGIIHGKVKKALLILYLCLTAYAQTAAGQIIENKNSNVFDTLLLSKECNLNKDQLEIIFTRPEIDAEFPGGFRKWFDFARTNFDFAYVLQQLGDTVQHFEDSIFMTFIVARNGTICNIKIQTGNPILTNPSLKLLKLSPNWQPGLNGGRQLNSYRTLRLDILIDKKENIKTIRHYTNSYFRDNE